MMMRFALVLAVLTAVALSAACKRPESTDPQAEPAPVVEEASPQETETVAPEVIEAPAETPSSTADKTATPEPSQEPAATPPVPDTLTAATPTSEQTPASATAEPSQSEPVASQTEEPEKPASQPSDTSAPPAEESTKPVTRAASDKVPKNHTVDQDGFRHAPDAENAAKKCATCHGKELTGGKIAKTSCLECHERNWD